MTSRRAFITGLVSFVAAPAIVRVSSIMPVKAMEALQEVKLEQARIHDVWMAANPYITGDLVRFRTTVWRVT